jgi:tetratricopeptide (TPR) repeat protein
MGLLAGQMGQHEVGLPYLKTALELKPSHLQYLLTYVDALLTTGLAQKALDVLQAAKQRGIENPAIQLLLQKAQAALKSSMVMSGAQPTSLETNQIVSLFNAGLYPEVETRARLLIEKYPTSGFAWNVLGVCLKAQGKDALPALQKTADLLPGSAEAHSNLGNALREVGRFNDAVESCHKALSIQPGYAKAHSNLGNALQDLGKTEEAITSFRRALELKPDFFEVHYNLGNALRDFRQLDAAVASYQKAIEFKPDFAEAHNNLGYVLIDLNQLSEAASSFQKSIKINPDQNQARLGLAISNFELEKYDEALNGYLVAQSISNKADVLLSDIASVKEYCKNSQSPYHLIEPSKEIFVSEPGYVGENLNVATGKFESNELYVAELHGATILSKHDVVIAKDNLVLSDNLHHPLSNLIDLRFERAIVAHSKSKIMMNRSNYNNLLKKEGVYLGGVSTKVFGHWIYEHLPKIKLIDSIPEYKHYPIFVDDAMPKSHLEALALFADNQREIVVIAKGTSITFEKLVVASTFTCFPFATKSNNVGLGSFSLDALTFLRQRALSALSLSSDVRPDNHRGRRIYLARKVEGRKLVNSAEIQDYLSQYNIEIVYPEDFSFFEQIKIFNESECVFGPHGSAFANIIFCRKNTKVANFVFDHNNGNNYAAWAEVVGQLGINHLYVVGAAIPAARWHDHHLDYSLPLPLIQQALQQLNIERYVD